MKKKIICIGLIFILLTLGGISSFALSYNELKNFPNAKVINKDIDVKIVYDRAALEYIYKKWKKHWWDLDDLVEVGLNHAYDQNKYTKGINFHASSDYGWTVYDSNGFSGDKSSLLNYAAYSNGWHNDVNWKKDKILPHGGHGKQFEMLVMFTANKKEKKIFAVTGGVPDGPAGLPLDKNYMVVNLAKFHRFNDFNSEGFWGNNIYGVYSALLHETGHMFGINGNGNKIDKSGKFDNTGDTTKKRKSVMDYYYTCEDYNSGRSFDKGHIETITNRANTFIPDI